jgi:hypothetical protein
MKALEVVSPVLTREIEAASEESPNPTRAKLRVWISQGK